MIIIIMANKFNVVPAGMESDEDELDCMLAHLKIKRLEDITTGRKKEFLLQHMELFIYVAVYLFERHL